jgi:CMP-N,N'-diacetyllegionaminic acid synthase
MRVLGIIPARGGSKGVPRKNVRLLEGKPLLAYTAESALSSTLLTRTIVSTDDPEISEVAHSLGLETPFLRPAELAQDETPTFPVVLHAVIAMESMGDKYDAVCLLQPTNPLRTSQDIDACIRLLESSGADSVISMLQVPDSYNPKWVYWRTADGRMELSTGDAEPISRRQDLPKAFHREGSVYVTRRDVLFEHGNLYGNDVRGYQMNPERSVNIDTEDDWQRVEHVMSVTNAVGISS